MSELFTHSPSGTGKRIGKMLKLVGWDKGSLIRKKKKKGMENYNKKCIHLKLVMQNLIAHHPLTNAQPVPKQRYPQPTLASFIVSNIIWCRISLWPSWVNCAGSVPCQLLVHLQPLGWQDSTRSWKVLDTV